jgi:signal transduction histidine kinase
MPPTNSRPASLERKLPILICGLLAGVVVLNAALSYGVVRDSALAVGRERLRSVSNQLANLLANSVSRADSAMRVAAADTTIVRFLSNPDSRNRAAALAQIGRTRGRSAQVLAIELWNARGELVLTNRPGEPKSFGDLSSELLLANDGPRFSTVGRIRPIRDTLSYPVVAASRSNGNSVGYFVTWLRITTSAEGRAQTLQLLGSDAALYIGSDSVWTDLAQAVAAPSIDVRSATDVVSYSREASPPVVVRGQRVSSPVFGRARPIAGTPWYVLVEFPETAVMSAVESYMRRASVIGILVIALGFVLAWRLSRAITRPLVTLTEASSTLATGEFAPLPDLARGDEVGALATAFNAMALRVRNTQIELEDRVRERTRKLEERNEELEAFAHTVAHDLRAPIRSMHGFSDALLQDFGPALGERGRDYARRVLDAAKRMDDLVRDLLEYSQIARGTMELAPVELTGVVRSVLAHEDADIRAAGAAVTVEGPLPAVIGHDATMTRALMNLVGNALKFVAPGKSPAVTISAERREAWTRLWVVDNGLGIDPEKQEMIFRVFERLHRRDEYPGTGIGLAIVRKGVERMGGRSGVESVPGGGSRFWIELQTAGSPA